MPLPATDEIPNAREIDSAGNPIAKPAKRKGGRPKGSLNKTTLARLAAAATEQPAPVATPGSSAAGSGISQPAPSPALVTSVATPATPVALPAPKPVQVASLPAPTKIAQPAASNATQTPVAAPVATQQRSMRTRRG